MSRKVLWSVIVFCGIGLLLALISLVQSNTVAQLGLAAESFCNINTFINCDLVQASSYAKFLGVPTAGWGFLFYLWVGVLTLWALSKNGKEHSSPLTWVWVGSVLSLGYSGYMAWVSLAVLHALCLVCVGIYIVNIVLFILLWIASRTVRFQFRLQQASLPALLAIGLFGLGGVVLRAQAANQTRISPEDLKTIVQLHFRQSEYPLELPADRPSWGNPKANVVVVEFSDFQCPHCKHAADFIKPTLNEFRNQIQFHFLHYPIDASCNPQIKQGGHPHACLAAKAAICAGEKGDFWGFHDDLFREQPKISPEFIDSLVAKRGWDAEEFKYCLAAESTLKTIQDDVALGEKLNIGGTPTVFIGNRRVKYWAYPEVLRGIVRASSR